MGTDTTHYVPPLGVIYHKKSIYNPKYTGMFYSEFVSDNISTLYHAIPTNLTWFSVQGRQDLQLRGLEQRRGQSQTALPAPFGSAEIVFISSLKFLKLFLIHHCSGSNAL